MMEEALTVAKPRDEVRYVVSYLSGDALRWFMALCTDGKRPASWASLRSQLEATYAPANEDARYRRALLKARQDGGIEDYNIIAKFRRLCLDCRQVDDLTCTMIFIDGLSSDIRSSVMREHPNTLQTAIRAARTAAELLSEQGPSASVPTATSEDLNAAWSAEYVGTISPQERRKLYLEGRCFRCRKLGHIARYCKARQSKNAYRQ